jgi:ABC-type transport system involved in multi-copper enzyme maturation permease subunit
MIAPAQRRSPFSDLWDNSIIHREGVPRRLRQMKRWKLFALVLVVGVGEVLIALSLVDPLGGATHVIALIAGTIWAGLAVLLAALHGARTIAQERASGTWDQVIVSSLSRRQIVMGKLLGTLLPLWLPGVVLLPFIGVLLMVAPDPLPAAAWMALIYAFALVGGVCAASLGLWWSLRARSVFSAQLATVLTGWAATMFLPVIFVGAAALVHLLTRFDAIERARRA